MVKITLIIDMGCLIDIYKADLVLPFCCLVISDRENFYMIGRELFDCECR
jgi:hypothetical protein